MTKNAISEELVKKTENALARQNSAIIAIDGRCGSGKTFFADILKEFFSASVIRADDFFLPTYMRTEERLSLSYGNVHFERLQEVLKKVKEKKNFTYERYVCKTGKYEKADYIFSPVTIVEGSYSLNSELARFYDVKVLVTAKESVRLERLKKREKENYVNFEKKWIPLEERYFSSSDFSDCVIVDLS